MKSTNILTILRLALFIACFLPATMYGGQQGNSMPEGVASDPSSQYATPEGKAPNRKNLQHQARKEYKVCLEHCANDAECTARCAQAYSRRMAVANQGQTN